MPTDRKRGAVRSEEARLAILGATAELVTRNGYDQLSMEGIAAQARVGKQTIYRWWPSKSALVAECLVEGMLIPDWLTTPHTGDARRDLELWLTDIVGFLQEPGNSSLVRSLIVAAAENEEVARRLSERLGALDLMEHASGYLAAVRAELTQTLLGAVVFRVLSREPFDADYVARLIRMIGIADA